MTANPASYNYAMETSEFIMFGKICTCLAVFGNIGKHNSNYIVDTIIYPLEKTSLIIFVVGCTLFRWEDNSMEFPVYIESATEQFPSFISCLFLCLALELYLRIHMYFKIHCNLYQYSLMNYVYDNTPCLFIILLTIRVTYCFLIPPLGRIT